MPVVADPVVEPEADELAEDDLALLALALTLTLAVLVATAVHVSHILIALLTKHHLPLPTSLTMVNASCPKLVAQQPK